MNCTRSELSVMLQKIVAGDLAERHASLDPERHHNAHLPGVVLDAEGTPDDHDDVFVENRFENPFRLIQNTQRHENVHEKIYSDRNHLP